MIMHICMQVRVKRERPFLLMKDVCMRDRRYLIGMREIGEGLGVRGRCGG